MVEIGRYSPPPLHRQGQHRVPLHRLSSYAQGGRLLHPSRQRAFQRISQFGRRQNLHFAQLGSVVARYLQDFPGKQDVLRYVLTANAPETRTTISRGRFQARNNNELVAVYGNFVNRALQLTQKYYEGEVPACGELTESDRATIEEFQV